MQMAHIFFTFIKGGANLEIKDSPLSDGSNFAASLRMSYKQKKLSD